MGRFFGWQPRAKVSMMIIRPPQQGHGRDNMRGWSASAVASGISGCFGRDGARRANRGRMRYWPHGCPIGEQAIVSDAVEAVRQNVDEEAADELVGGERHRLVAGAAVGTIILVPEGDAVLVEGDEPAVGDGDAVGIARQIGEHRLGSTPNGDFK